MLGGVVLQRVDDVHQAGLPASYLAVCRQAAVAPVLGAVFQRDERRQPNRAHDQRGARPAPDAFLRQPRQTTPSISAAI